MLKIGKMAFQPVIRIIRFITFRGKHIPEGVSLINYDNSAGLHAFCDHGKEPVQVIKPAKRANGDDHHIESFLVQVVNIVYIGCHKRTGQMQFIRLLIGESDLVFGNVKTDSLFCFAAFDQGKQFTTVVAAELPDHRTLGMDLFQDIPGFLVEERIVFLLYALCDICSPGSIPVVKSLFPGRFVSLYIFIHIMILRQL